jgi:hypothetical protein
MDNSCESFIGIIKQANNFILPFPKGFVPQRIRYRRWLVWNLKRPAGSAQ